VQVTKSNEQVNKKVPPKSNGAVSDDLLIDSLLGNRKLI